MCHHGDKLKADLKSHTAGSLPVQLVGGKKTTNYDATVLVHQVSMYNSLQRQTL